MFIPSPAWSRYSRIITRVLKAEDARLRNFFENLRKICTFEQEIQKKQAFLAQFDKIIRI